MMTFTLTRSALGPISTPGVLECPNDDGTSLEFATLELPWRQNAPKISCIPAGRYQVVFAWSDRWNRLVPWLVGVPHRSAIEMHVGNVPRDTDGCIIVGSEAAENAVLRSQKALARFEAWLGRAARELVFIQITDPPTRPAVEAA